MCRYVDIEDFVIESSEKTLSDEDNEYSKHEFQEIKDFRKKIPNINIFKRKEIAKKEYKKFIETENKNIDEFNIKNNYIKIVCLLLIDNTNKDIVKLYLNFIKKNSNFINENKLLTFEKEINKYKILFTVDEIKQFGNNIKNKSQKVIYLEYLRKIISINLKNKTDIENFLKETKKNFNNLFLFNTPIEFDNKELFYYKCYYNLLYEILNRDDFIQDYLKNKQNVISYILKKNLYNNLQITSNEDKMDSLSIYLLRDEFYTNDKEDELINFNRLIQKSPVTINEFSQFNKGNNRNNLKKMDNVYYVSHKVHPLEEELIFIPLKNVCLNNLNNHKFEGDNNIKSYYNFDALLLNNEISRYIDNIKKFLNHIVDSNVYKQALKELFPDYYDYLTLNDSEEIKQYIDERMKFYPFQDLSTSGITDKLSCNSFITSVNFKLYDKDFSIINKDVFKAGLTIVNCIHEINHANQIIIYFKGNKIDLINSPERELKDGNNTKVKEGGIILEYILFGKIISNINLLECLYIMNEDNYKQDINEFKNNFMNLRELVKVSEEETKFIKIENGIFKDFYQNSIDEIKKIVEKLKKRTDYFLPSMYVGKNNKEINQENYYIPPKKCGLIGGWKKFH